MFGILEKMDRFSNNLMSQDEYQSAAIELINEGKVMCAVLRRIPAAKIAAEVRRPVSPFWRSICY
jgi:hypothetical protein